MAEGKPDDKSKAVPTVERKGDAPARLEPLPENAPDPSKKAQELGVGGLLEEFFAKALDGKMPRYSEVPLPSALEKRARSAAESARDALNTGTGFGGTRGALERQERIDAAERMARKVRDETEVARGILTKARLDYAGMVNVEHRRRRDAAMEVVAGIVEADEANNHAVSHVMSGAYSELVTAARAEAAGRMPYLSETSYKPYEIPKVDAAKKVYSPGEERKSAVEQARATIDANVAAMKEVRKGHAQGNFSIPNGVQPLVVEDFLTELSYDMKDGVLNNQGKRPINFVPIDPRVLAGMGKDVQESVKRIDEALKRPLGAGVSETLAADIAKVSGVLTGKANELSRMQGPLRTPNTTAQPDAPVVGGKPKGR